LKPTPPGDQRPRAQLSFPWPNPPLEIALVHPEIPPNTGNIARLCAATGTRLHLVEPLGYRITDKELRRAGLDYGDSVEKTIHPNFDHFHAWLTGRRFHLFTTGGTTSLFEARFSPGDVLVFGRESTGLPLDFLASHPDRLVNIPQRLDHVRSLNLSTAAGIATFEALRQCASSTP
jgi:tRNA (cytidine/uridine-2'-O-)-methyltransferase